MSTTQKHVLIAGATGQVGRAVATHLLGRGWKVTGLSRGNVAAPSHAMVQVDLTDAADCQRKLSGLADLTHVIYAARFDQIGGQTESVEINTAMLAHVLDAAIPVAPQLEHVHLVHGTKFYGHNRTPSAVAFREDMPRGAFENFYFEQQDMVENRRNGKDWTWSISRPHSFCNFSRHEPRSIVLAVAIYAALLRAQGLPLIFPGTEAAYAARTQFTWLPMLAEAIECFSTDPRCANQAFNVVNDDPRSWSVLWPRIASALHMPVGPAEPCLLAHYVKDRQVLWKRLVREHGLEPTELVTVVQWPYADYVFTTQWDVISSMAKARRSGFAGHVDTLQMWDDSLAFLAREKIVPRPA